MTTDYIYIYNNFIKLTTNKKLYFGLTSQDTFNDRLLLFLIHFAFFLKEYKNSENTKILQKIYDSNFRQLELSIREIGYGDQSINKKMKDYINIFYSILDKINDWNNLDDDKKGDILGFYYNLKDNHQKIVNYFNNFEIYLSKTTLNSFTKSVINHKFQIMAVPKRKTTKSRAGKRRSHIRLNIKNVIEDKKSGEYRLSHHMDLKTGFYKGRQVIDPKE